MTLAKPYPLILGIVVLFLFARPTLAFGAGNIAGISKVEGQNWRHGDIEDTLLKILMARAVGGKKFDKMMVSRVYFGNWLRDYSQAIDVGTVKNVSAEAIRLLLCVLGFLSFGYGSREFEVTADRLGCYRPEDHIDNPKNYADNVDARQYDQRLRGPVNERVELAIDEETGMKNYIANERVNIMTSGLHVRRLLSGCIQLGRNYHRNSNKQDLYEALRLLGTALHCLEDFLAHSNYTELALIELGERDVFPHVGSRTQIRLRGARREVYPIVTGTFGGVDFLHSVTGEVSDKLTQNEIEELEGTLQNARYSDTSVLENLLDQIPDGIFGGENKKQKIQDIQNNANAAQVQNMSVSPREPEEYTRYVQQIFQQIMPAIEFHDEVIQRVSEALEKIPLLMKIIEQLQEQLTLFVFSIIAPFVVPVINQIKNELRTGSSEIIESSKNEQHIVFHDDRCSDPTHSMLSKDHFSNILNEIAGRTASKVVAWVVPQIMDAWDDEGANVERTLNRIISGVLHHPAQRDMGEDGARDGRSIMFRSVEDWWNEKSEREKNDFRRKLSRDGVERGENHKEGVHDTGHGCGKPLGMHKQSTGGGTTEDRIASAIASTVIGKATGGLSSIVESQTGVRIPQYKSPQSEESGGGVLSIMSKFFGGDSEGEPRGYETQSKYRNEDGDIVQQQSTVTWPSQQSSSSWGDGSGQQYSGQQYSGQQYSGQQYSGQQYSGQQYYEQQDSGPGYGYSEETTTTYGHGRGDEADQFTSGASALINEGISQFLGGGGDQTREYEEEGSRRDEYGGGGYQYDNRRDEDDESGDNYGRRGGYSRYD